MVGTDQKFDVYVAPESRRYLVRRASISVPFSKPLRLEGEIGPNAKAESLHRSGDCNANPWRIGAKEASHFFCHIKEIQ